MSTRRTSCWDETPADRFQPQRLHLGDVPQADGARAARWVYQRELSSSGYGTCVMSGTLPSLRSHSSQKTTGSIV